MAVWAGTRGSPLGVTDSFQWAGAHWGVGMSGTTALTRGASVKGTADRGDERPIRVLVCENDPVMRSALTDLVRAVPGIELIGAAGDADEAAAAAARTGPDVALLDVRMPKGGGPEAARLIRACCPHTRLIAFSAHADRSVVLEMLRAGVTEYLIKGVDDDELVDAIRRTGRGRLGLGGVEMAELVFDLVEMLSQAERQGAVAG